MKMVGIDISKHQGTVNFEKVKASGIQFVIVRAGFGMYESQKDPRFDEYYDGAKRSGLHIGAYWYSYATNVDEAKREAETCLSVIKGKQFDFPVWFDQEYEPGIKAASKETRTACVKAFCDALESAGYYTGLYCSRDWLNNWLDYNALKQYDIWVAAYANTPGKVALPYGIWQRSSQGRIDGIDTNVDLDECYKDYPSIIKSAGLNGYTKDESAETAQKPSTARLQVIKIGPITEGDAAKIKALCDSLDITNMGLYSAEYVE